MTRWHDTDKTDVTVHYDNAGRVTATATPQGYWQDRFEYDDDNNVTTYFDAEGGCTRYHYNADGLVTRKVDPLGHASLTEWDFSCKVAETDPLGRTTAYEYSPYGELTGLLSPTGDVTAYDYDEYGQLTQVTQPDGARWRLHYSEQGNLSSVIDPQGRVEETRYGPQGEILRQVLPDGRAWRYGYEQQQLSEIQAPDGARTRFDIDGLGRLRRVTDALYQQTRYHHSPSHASPAGSVSEICLPDGVRQTIDYDSERRVSAVTDGEGRTTRYTYDAFDLLSRLTRPDGSALTFGYDRLTRLKTVTNATGDTYRYTRDPAGRVIRETDFTGRTIDYQYDRAGRRLIARYPNHQLLRWCYTDDDRLTRQEVWQEAADQCALLSVTAYDHDAQGRLVRAANPDAVVAFEYDESGRLITETINGRAVRHQWDPQSGLPAGRQVDALPALRWHYGLNGRLMQWQLDGHAPLNMQHDGLGRESAAGFIQSQAYTPVGLLAHQAAGRSSDWFKQTLYEADPHYPPLGSAVTRRWHYTPAYNVACIEDPLWDETRYGYNANDQVVTAQFGGPRACDEQFVYDAGQNLHYHKRVPERLSEDLRQAYHTQQTGRVVQHGACTYRYDENGRRTEKTEQRWGHRPRTWRYRWDAHDRLTGVISPEGTRWRYCYDAFGRRISKRKEADPAGPPAKPTTIIGYDYLWSGEQLIEETPVYADGTVDYEQSIHWLYEPGALTPSARYQKGQLYYVVSDHQGTVREILTEAGELLWAGRLLTWGEPERWPVLTVNDPRNLTCNFRFCGQYEDSESGLYYNRFRYYDNEIGQYLCADPLNLSGGFNPYGYVHDPVNWIDPLGLAGCPGAKNKKTTYEGKSRRDALRQAKRDTGIPNIQQPKIDRVDLLDGNGKKIIGSNGQVIKVRQYHYTNKDGKPIVIQEHSLGHEKATPGHGAEPHFNVRPITNLGTGDVPGTHGHYNFPKG
ncbi:HNH/endonuclease VII fold putative polymorphic toxin [Photorhabdus sp. RM126S]